MLEQAQNGNLKVDFFISPKSNPTPFTEVWDTWCDIVEKVAGYIPWMFAVGNHE